LGVLKIKLSKEELSGKLIDKWYTLLDESYFKIGKQEGEIRIIIKNNYEKPKFQIKKVVVLCLENRSFDHMLGYLDGVDGVKDKEDKYIVEGVKYNNKAEHVQIFDPGHQSKNIKEQLKGNVQFFKFNIINSGYQIVF
jgi:phospholipase C